MTPEPPSLKPAPPPLPESSRKRILPAFLLCFTVCAHRLYAGKIISGILQLGWIGGASLWAYESMKDLMKVANSGPQDFVSMMQRIGDWQEDHGSPSMIPTLVLFAAGIWVAVDAAQLVRRKFTDGKGLPITRWI